MKTICKDIKRFFKYKLNPIDRLNDLERWIAYRTYERYNLVPSGLEPSYYEPSELLLYASFNLLKKWVEFDLAQHQIYKEGRKVPFLTKCYFNLPNFIAHTFIPEFRSKEFGLEYIQEHLKYIEEEEYLSEEGKSNQRVFWKEVEELYLWWDGYETRPSAYKASGLEQYSEFLELKYGKVHSWIPASSNTSMMKFNGTPEEEIEYRRLLNLYGSEDERQDQEADDMLSRLMQIRRGLWT